MKRETAEAFEGSIPAARPATSIVVVRTWLLQYLLTGSIRCSCLNNFRRSFKTDLFETKILGRRNGQSLVEGTVSRFLKTVADRDEVVVEDSKFIIRV